MNSILVIGMAELIATRSPISISTIGLGSCVGICLYDQKAKVAGMAHAMLPDSKKIINNTNQAKFVDTSITKLIQEMAKQGASASRLTAKIVGGAQMFLYESGNENMRIGDRNVEATYSVLKSLRIPVLAVDVGLNYGRTVVFDSTNGSILIKTIAHGNKTI